VRGGIVGGRDLASAGARVVEALPTFAEQLFRPGPRHNVEPGMVWDLAIHVPIFFLHTESRHVSTTSTRSFLVEGRTMAARHFFLRADVTTR